jgi:tRNA pseudouridine-54 N-methylase
MPHVSEYPLLRFIQLLLNAPVTGDFLLRDLSGSGKRIDVLCRDLAACFDWGAVAWPPSKIELIALLGNDIILTFRNPNYAVPIGERGWAMIIKRSLQGQPPDNVSVTQGDLRTIIRKFNQPPRTNLWVLHEEGQTFDKAGIQVTETQNSFMLGDTKGFDSQSEEIISRHNLVRVSLGEISYLSSHCIVSIISRFERMVK